MAAQQRGISILAAREPPSPNTPEERQKHVKSSPVYGEYDEAVDRETAYEKLAKRANERAEAQEKAAAEKRRHATRDRHRASVKRRRTASSRMSPAASAARSARWWCARWCAAYWAGSRDAEVGVGADKSPHNGLVRLTFG
jgi:hypothetical protein